MKSHDWRFAGAIVNCEDVETERALGDSAFREEMLRGAGRGMLFAGCNTEFG
jgi:hypothetical protein